MKQSKEFSEKFRSTSFPEAFDVVKDMQYKFDFGLSFQDVLESFPYTDFELITFVMWINCEHEDFGATAGDYALKNFKELEPYQSDPCNALANHMKVK